MKNGKKLGATVQTQFKKKLENILDNPHVESTKLSGGNELYKIKLRQNGYQLVYEVNETVVTVISVGKRDKGKVYTVAMERIN